MDSEVTNLALVKALAKGISDGNVLTANDAVADDDFLRINGTEVEGLTVAEVLTALNVEAAADVTDATNVSSAGALMKSGGTMAGTVDFGSEAMSNGIWSGGTLGNNLDADSNKIEDLAAGTANGDSLRFEQLRTIKNDNTTTAYRLLIGDARKEIRINNASTHTLTVPDDTFQPGDVVTIFRKGAGGVTIAAASGVTINSVGAKLKLASQYSAATLICITKAAGASEFDLIGDLTA